jgi:hypothetical protein
LTLDSGALIALERGERRMIALLDSARKEKCSFRIPSGVVGQAWRDGRTQATLSRFLRVPEVQVVPLDEYLARFCGELCGFTNTSDVIDASVVIVARQNHDVILTSDVEDMRRLDPVATVFEI